MLTQHILLQVTTISIAPVIAVFTIGGIVSGSDHEALILIERQRFSE